MLSALKNLTNLTVAHTNDYTPFAGARESFHDRFALADGGYVAVWSLADVSTPPENAYTILAQRYDADGTEVGTILDVSGVGTAVPLSLSTGIGLMDGGFAIAWSNPAVTGQVQLRVYDAVGVGGDVQNIDSEKVLEDRARTLDLYQTWEGGFSVRWTQLNRPTGPNRAETFFHDYTSDGNPTGPIIQHTSATAEERAERLMLGDGLASPISYFAIINPLAIDVTRQGTRLSNGDELEYSESISVAAGTTVFVYRNVLEEDGSYTAGNKTAFFSVPGDQRNAITLHALRDGGLIAIYKESTTTTETIDGATTVTTIENYVAQTYDNELSAIGTPALVGLAAGPSASNGVIADRHVTNVVELSSGRVMVTINDFGATYTAVLGPESARNNTGPVAQNDTFTLQEDTPLGLSLVANDTDSDGDPLEATIVSGPSHGALSMTDASEFTYTPDENYAGPDGFTYRVSDGRGGTEFARVTLTVQEVADTPVAGDDTFVGLEDELISGSLASNDFDGDSDTLTYTLVSGPDSGDLTLTGSTFTYAAAPHFFGDKSFVYRATDTTGRSDTATVTMTIQSVNDLPVVQGESYSVAEDEILNLIDGTLLQNDSDADGETLSVSLAQDVAHGTLELSPAGGFQYRPDADFNGSDHFTYAVNDGNGTPVEARVNITIDPVADTPFPVDDVVVTDEDAPIDIDVLANDFNPDDISVFVVGTFSGAGGIASILSNGLLRYTPFADFHGTDSFTYDIAPVGLSGTVSVTVNPVNDVPIAGDDAYGVFRDETLVIPNLGVLGNDSDADGDFLFARLVTDVQHGTLGLQPNGSFTYTPDLNFTGLDTFTYEASDGPSAGPAEVTIRVINGSAASYRLPPPEVRDDAVTLTESETSGDTDGNVRGNDANAVGAPLPVSGVNGNAALLSQPVAGSNGGLFTINPDGGFDFDANLEFEDLDVGETRTTTVDYTITFTGLARQIDVVLLQDLSTSFSDDLPQVRSQIPSLFSTLNEGRDARIGISSFVDRPVLPFGVSGDYVYQTNLALTDDLNAIVSTLNSLSVKNGNDIPESQIEALMQLALRADTEVGFRSDSQRFVVLTTDAGFHVAGDYFTAPPNDGDAVVEDEDFPTIEQLRVALEAAHITPIFSISGADLPAYQELVASLGRGVVVPLSSDSSDLTSAIVNGLANVETTEAAQLTVTVTGEADSNFAPLGNDDVYAVLEDGQLSVSANGVLVNDSDLDGDPLISELVSNVSNGVLSLARDGGFVYTPTADFSGRDSFRYRVSDGEGGSDIAEVTINVSGLEDAPVAGDDVFSTRSDQPLTISQADLLANDFDADGDVLHPNLVTNPTHGQIVQLENGSFVYTPDIEFAGIDRFTYAASDGTQADTATVSITVTETGDDVFGQGTNGDDFLIGTVGDDVLSGREGDDTIYGEGGEDNLSGGPDDDVIFADNASADYYGTSITNQVYRLYQATLDRAPDALGHSNWTGRIATGERSYSEVIDGFVGSPEFVATFPADATSEAFVRLLYQNVLNNDNPDAQGLARWTGELDEGTSRATVVSGFAESPQFIAETTSAANAFAYSRVATNWSDEVFRLYQATLARAPDVTGQTNWAERLADGILTLTEVAGAFVGSPEFTATFPADATADTFVRLLYKNVLNNDNPDTQGLTRWTQELEGGASRAEVVLGFSQSPQFAAQTAAGMKAWMRDQGVDDRLVGGAGGNLLAGGQFTDVFVFDAATDSANTIADLEAWDFIDLTRFGYSTATAARAEMTQAGGNLVFSDQGVEITFLNRSLSDLTDDLILV
jgi:hypothetical protein